MVRRAAAVDEWRNSRTGRPTNVVEVTDPNGRVRYRYARTKSADGKTWIRQGRFVSHHPNGTIESEGTYEDGAEEGLWRDFYANGLLAAEGTYRRGKEDGIWRFWSEDGKQKEISVFRDGQEVSKLYPASRD